MKFIVTALTIKNFKNSYVHQKKWLRKLWSIILIIMKLFKIPDWRDDSVGQGLTNNSGS